MNKEQIKLLKIKKVKLENDLKSSRSFSWVLIIFFCILIIIFKNILSWLFAIIVAIISSSLYKKKQKELEEIEFKLAEAPKEKVTEN